MHAFMVPPMPRTPEAIETLPEPPATVAGYDVVQRGDHIGVPSQPGARRPVIRRPRQPHHLAGAPHWHPVLLQPLELGYRGPRVLRPPLKVRRLADVVLPEDLGDRDARLPLLQDLDNLALREPRLSHGHLLGPGKSTVEVSTGRGSLR